MDYKCFEGSNGTRFYPNGDSLEVYALGGDTVHAGDYIRGEVVQDFREFFSYSFIGDSEGFEPINGFPGYFARMRSTNLRTRREVDIRKVTYTTSSFREPYSMGNTAGCTELDRAACQWFIDHPKDDKPWDHAKEGEIWVLELQGGTAIPCTVTSAGNFKPTYGKMCDYYFTDSSDIISARMIYKS